MYTGPLQQLLALTDNENRAYRQGEGERLCLTEIPKPAHYDAIAAADDLQNRRVLGLWDTILDVCRRKFARPRRPHAV